MASLASTVGIAAASALLGGLIGGFLAAQLSTPATPETSRERAQSVREATPDGDEDPELKTRVSELERRLARMEQQRRATDALRDYARTLAKSEGAPASDTAPAPTLADAEDPAFELAVRSVLDRVDWEREEEERVTRAQQRSERAERQTALLTQRLSLSDEQAEAVALALNRQMERFRELRDAKGDQRPATREEWRNRTTAIREETEKRLGEILSAEQFEGYRAFVEGEGLGPRDWGGWGRPRPAPSQREP